MNEFVLVACASLVIIGTAAAILERDPFNKLISLSIMISGIFPFIVDRGYLDVTAATALIAPLATIFILMVCRRESSG